MADAGLRNGELPDPEERQKILNQARLVCNRAQSLVEALDASSGLQTLQRDMPPEGLTLEASQDSAAESKASV